MLSEIPLFSQKSNRKFSTALVGCGPRPANSAPDGTEKTWDREVWKRGNPAKAIQSISCRGKIVPYVVLKGASSRLPTASSKTPIYRSCCHDYIFVLPVFGEGFCCLPACFSLIFSHFLLFFPTSISLALHFVAVLSITLTFLPSLNSMSWALLNKGAASHHS